MIETVTSYNSFWLIIISAITIISIGSILGIVIVKLKTKDNGLFNNIFNKHVDEHTDTTDKMKSITDNIVHVKFGKEHELELHSLECNILQLQKDLQELNAKMDLLVERIIKIEKQNIK